MHSPWQSESESESELESPAESFAYMCLQLRLLLRLSVCLLALFLLCFFFHFFFNLLSSHFCAHFEAEIVATPRNRLSKRQNGIEFRSRSRSEMFSGTSLALAGWAANRFGRWLPRLIGVKTHTRTHTHTESVWLPLSAHLGSTFAALFMYLRHNYNFFFCSCK